MIVFDKHGVKGLSDDELKSDSAYRLQDIQRRLAQVSGKLTSILAAIWLLVAIILSYIAFH